MTVRLTTSDFPKGKTCRMHHNQSCKNEIKKDILGVLSPTINDCKELLSATTVVK